ncbi:UNVERIFIED_CONTAM: hypothetical protein FKN15_027729 [Acipenser sinensis]
MGGNETSDLEWLKSSSRQTHSSITNSWKKDSEALQPEELTELRAAVSELAEATATAGIVESRSPLPAADIDSPEILALIVIELNPRIQRETENWLLGRILGSREEGGADLLAKVVSRSERMEGTVVLVAATLDRLLEGAEEMVLLKEDLAGTPKVFSYAERHSFLNFREGDGGFLTSAEALHIVKHALDNLRADTEEHVPGEPAAQLYPGKSIFRKLIASHLLREMYPLHDPLLLKELEEKWYGRLQVFRQPLKDIRNYGLLRGIGGLLLRLPELLHSSPAPQVCCVPAVLLLPWCPPLLPLRLDQRHVVHPLPRGLETEEQRPGFSVGDPAEGGRNGGT